MERTMSEQAASQTQTETISEPDVTDSGSQDIPTVRLRLRKPKSNKKVQWTQGTVDNENLNKKKSKCCCIYEKPKTFGESSSEDSDDECEHCHGHKDAHKKVLPKGDSAREGMSSHPEPIATVSVIWKKMMDCRNSLRDTVYQDLQTSPAVVSSFGVRYWKMLRRIKSGIRERVEDQL